METPSLLSCEVLDETRREAVFRAIRNLLESDLAITTFAQIVDGLPTFPVYESLSYGSKDYPEFPLISHVEVCPRAMEKTKEILSELDLMTLKFSQALFHSFKKTDPSSKSFGLRIIEFVAVTIHQIAVNLHRLGLKLHDPQTTNGQDVDAVIAWREPSYIDSEGCEVKSRRVHFPSRFSTGFYEYELYPNGVHDMVGFWAEKCIMGGVSLFKRSGTWKKRGEPEPNVYFDSQRRDVTFFICQLLDKQQDDLLRFLTRDTTAPAAAAETASSKTISNAGDIAELTKDANWCPLPIIPGYYNRTRVHPADALYRRVYREKWERHDLSLHERTRKKRSCYRDLFLDYPDKHEKNAKFEEKKRKEDEGLRKFLQETRGDDESDFVFPERLKINITFISEPVPS